MARTNSLESHSSGLSSTRQMLDELDALMERMLALPVSDLDDELQMPSEALKPRSFIDDEPEEVAESPPATIPYYRTEAAEPPPAPVAPKPKVVNWKLEPPPALDEIAPPAIERAPLPELGNYPPPALSLRRILMAPLWLVNGLYDACTWWLGPIGRWLRAPSGRGMLGGFGVTLLLLAAAWLLLDWAGFTTWMGWN